MKTTNNKKGFTIIEVVLVLAIAGLIFMMVFIALPALQRAQRDTARSNDISRVQAALNQYQSNNRGAIPVDTPATLLGHTDKLTDEEAPKRGTWGYFYDEYLIVNSAGSHDTFSDPDGEPYSLIVQKCEGEEGEGTAKAGEECRSDQQRYNKTFDDQSDSNKLEDFGGSIGETTTSTDEPSHYIGILTHATCDGEAAVYSSGARKVAVLYKKEGGGAICVNN